MKLMRLAIWVAVFAVVGGIAFSEDLDIRALQAKLAAQEARLNDLQAKMNSSSGGDVAKGVMSYRKRGSVTIGGLMNTRYLYRKGNVKSIYPVSSDGLSAGPRPDGKGMIKREDFQYGDFRVEDAKLAFKVDVNEHFDAFCRLDLYDGVRRDTVSGNAQYYWVRWKNLCNSGWSILVGRDPIKFGDDQPIGVHDGYPKDGGGEIGDYMASAFRNWGNNTPGGNNHGEGMFAWGSMVPAHTSYQTLRTTQITPYWESQDGKIKAEFSLIQSLDRINGTDRYDDSLSQGDTRKWRGVNMGLGSGTVRLTWKPIEGLKFVASFMNLYTGSDHGTRVMQWYGNRPTASNAAGAPYKNYAVPTTSNNTAVNLAFQYRPCFMDRVNIWGQWIHGWNEAWVKDQDSDSFNVGFLVDITKRLKFFAQGEYLYVKNGNADVWYKGQGYGFYTGLKYSLPYGVDFEGGWRHDRIDYKNRAGQKHTKLTSDVIYGHLGFAF